MCIFTLRRFKDSFFFYFGRICDIVFFDSMKTDEGILTPGLNPFVPCISDRLQIISTDERWLSTQFSVHVQVQYE